MPTHTPSPHRFLAPTPHSAQKSTRPHSSLRNPPALASPASANAPTPIATPGLQLKRLTPAKRFVVTPLQKHVVPEAAKVEEADAKTRAGDAQAEHTPLSRPRRKLQRIESIEEPSQSSLPDENDEIHVSGVIPFTEDQDTLFDEQDEGNEDDEMLFESTARSKRRRMSPPSSPFLQSPEPSTPLPVNNSTNHRFKVAPPRTPAPFPSISSVTAKTSTPAHRPHFILPTHPTSPPKTSRPPPEIFSPSRKHAKYLPGGLASTVSNWIIETASTGFAAQERTSGPAGGRETDHGVKIQLKITCLSRGGAHERNAQELECYAGGMLFAKSEIQPAMHDVSGASSFANPNNDKNVLLAGQGGSRGSRGVRVKVGTVIGVRAPTWEIDVGKEKWLVAVDWVIL
ncbi:hypothetical protein yc1106_06115 [Curvularia clavata]|uniref:Uncharacterized protein n=1 Tax=Curvularia clavata TaxID=95742 RepID=A0A9Q8ZAV7_CURCL|nr:hypothetical protein yc1106_06115 [Curvularia clavata]